MNENSLVDELKGVGDKTAKLLNKLGIITIKDLITYYPRDYDVFGELTTVSNLAKNFNEAEMAILKLRITGTPQLSFVKKFRITNCVASDNTGSVRLSWFNMPYLAKSLKVGATYIFRGAVKKKGIDYYLSQPQIIKEEDYIATKNELIPIYSLTKGITGQTIRKLVKQALNSIDELHDFIDDESLGLMPLNKAVHCMHFPTSYDEFKTARKRLVFEEFLSFMISVRLMKEDRARQVNMTPMIEVAQTKRIIEALPYSLTKAQLRTYREILNDMSGNFSMNRLVQGDVGSGKTIVAILSLITAAANGYQCAMMAPTEVLARQHFEEITDILRSNGMSDINVRLLVGSVTAKGKRIVKEEISSGICNIVIGTHALIQDDVSFKRLGLVITDEQHRFGVKQREHLSGFREDGNEHFYPHILAMSATPIPRTLAIILYGDLDISLIDELPASRLPIKNCVVGPNYRPSAYKFIEKQVNEGRQALVVCPMVEESSELEGENVIDYTSNLKEHLPGNFVIEYLHGKMKNSEKNQIMDRFSSGEINVLVSTTVIEVGINVPNTTVMLVENSERFGLAQLHQLRGRVGRGSYQSYCIFMCGSEKKGTLERLDILNKSNDGFKIAEEDLKQRGPGDMMGVRQSGELSFRIGDIYADAGTLKEASEYATRLQEEGRLKQVYSLARFVQPVL